MADCSWDFSEYSEVDLDAAIAAVTAKLLDLLVGPKSGSLDGGAFSEMSLSELQAVQASLNAEKRSRSVDPDVDDDFMAFEFEGASS